MHGRQEMECLLVWIMRIMYTLLAACRQCIALQMGSLCPVFYYLEDRTDQRGDLSFQSRESSSALSIFVVATTLDTDPIVVLSLPSKL